MILQERPNYILDAQTKKGERMTSFALELRDAVLDYQDWVNTSRLDNDDIWYADIFEFVDKKHVASVSLNENRLAIISPAPENSKVKFLKRNRFIARLKGELR